MPKSESCFVDTNAILRYLLKDVPEQFAAAQEFFEEVRTGRRKAVILESVVVECLHVLTKFYGVPRQDAAAPLGELLRYRGIANHDTRVLLMALDLFARTTLDPVDCLLAACVKQGAGKLFTFDKALAKAAGSVNSDG